MNKQNCVIQELIEKYGEWLEMAGEKSSALMVNILAKELIRERAKAEYYEKIIKAIRNL
ncbi:MAG: hypothetical protein AB7F64_09135 [Gammaproteobacteria bacterium]